MAKDADGLHLQTEEEYQIQLAAMQGDLGDSDEGDA